MNENSTICIYGKVIGHKVPNDVGKYSNNETIKAHEINYDNVKYLHTLHSRELFRRKLTNRHNLYDLLSLERRRIMFETLMEPLTARLRCRRNLPVNNGGML